MGLEDVDCILLAQDMDKWLALVNNGLYKRCEGGGDLLTSCTTMNFSRNTVLHGINLFNNPKEAP